VTYPAPFFLEVVEMEATKTDGVAELVDRLSTIVEMQAEVIDSLFRTLSQHVDTDTLNEALKFDAFVEVVDAREQLKNKFGDVLGEK
jgi:hypothetical protein